MWYLTWTGPRDVSRTGAHNPAPDAVTDVVPDPSQYQMYQLVPGWGTGTRLGYRCIPRPCTGPVLVRGPEIGGW